MVTTMRRSSTTSSSRWTQCSLPITSWTTCLIRTRPPTSTSGVNRTHKAFNKTCKLSTWPRMVSTITHYSCRMLPGLCIQTQKVTGMPQVQLRARRTKTDTCRSNSKTEGLTLIKPAKHRIKTKSSSTWQQETISIIALWCHLPPWTQLISRTKWAWCTNRQPWAPLTTASTNIKTQVKAKANTRKTNPNSNSTNRKMGVNQQMEEINPNLEADFLKTQTCHKIIMQIWRKTQLEMWQLQTQWLARSKGGHSFNNNVNQRTVAL